MTLGQTIRTLRREKKIKQKDLARLVGISTTALLNIEKDLSFPTTKTFRGICEAMGHSVGFVLISTLTEDDLPPSKRELFHLLVQPIKEYLFGNEQTTRP
jgi:transcriptional regulator with XRE-family HTH domain